jgi:hypothetical protein
LTLPERDPKRPQATISLRVFLWVVSSLAGTPRRYPRGNPVLITAERVLGLVGQRGEYRHRPADSEPESLVGHHVVPAEGLELEY